MALPGPTGHSSEIATVLAVGALAMLAGHAWGLLVVVTADAMMLGALWPVLAFPEAQTSTGVAIATIVLLTALPGIALLGRTVPRTVEMVVGPRSARFRSAGVACCAVLLAVWVALPVF
jgi:hypothetical protein